MREEPVIRPESLEPVGELGRLQAEVGPAVRDNCVATGRIDLDDRMSCPQADGAEPGGIHAFGRERIAQLLCLLPEVAGVADLGAGAGHGDGLIEPFSAGASGKVRARPGFARFDDAVHPIDVVDVE